MKAISEVFVIAAVILAGIVGSGLYLASVSEPGKPIIPLGFVAPVETCGDGVCSAGEDCSSCPQDCLEAGQMCCDGNAVNRPSCGTCQSVVCSGTAVVCRDDSPCCGNGRCESGENCENCADCLEAGQMCCDGNAVNRPSCGNCQEVECEAGSVSCVTRSNCCGNGICESGEDLINCSQDCKGKSTSTIVSSGEWTGYS